MTKKTDLRHIGMVMLVMCTALIMTVLPAAANYTADQPLDEYKKGTVTGGMNYTIGDSYYSGKMWNGDSYTVNLTPTFPESSNTETARLYVHWTWSFLNTSSGSYYDTSVLPNMTVTINGGAPLALDRSYWDCKDVTKINTGDVMYNYASGTYAYNVTTNINAGTPQTYVVNVTNAYPYNGDVNGTTGDDTQSFCIQAVGLLTTYNDIFGGTEKYYWIDEGCDVTYTKWSTTSNSWSYGITPDDAVSLANFTGLVDTANVSSAELITCVPSGGTQYNRLYVNYFFNYPAWQNIKYWNGLWNADPYADFSWTETEVKDNLIDGTNYVGFQNGLYTMLSDPDQEKQMQAANAFLLLTYN